MHAQMDRLYQAAYELKGIRGQTALAFALNESPQTLSNWESRGISSNGLLSAQEKIGCNAIWVRDGVGTMRFAVEASGASCKNVAQPTPIQSALVTIVGSLVADGKLTDNMCLKLIGYINGLLAAEKVAESPEK